MTFNFINNKDFMRNAFCFMYGGLGCLIVVLGSYFLFPQSKVLGTVNVTSLVKQYINNENAKNLSEAYLKKEVKIFGNELDTKLQQFAKQHHMILILSDAVITGAPDYTDNINKQMHSNRGQN
jgi:type-F conjugative transfer system protein TrbI